MFRILVKYALVDANQLLSLTNRWRITMSETKEKDNFWIYVAGLVLAVIVTVVMIKSAEHGKYESTAKAIAENPANSAYRN